MGLNLRQLGSGLAAGLGTYSKLKLAEEEKDENTRRYEEGKAQKQKEFASQERLREMQIKESEGRIKEQQFKAWMNNSMMYKARVTAGVNAGGLKKPQYMIDVLNKNNPAGIQTRRLPGSSEEGPSNKIVLEYGVFRDNEDGTGHAVDSNGDKIIDWSGAMDEYTGIDDPKWTKHVFDASDPGYQTSRQAFKQSSAMELEALTKKQAMKDKAALQLAKDKENLPSKLASTRVDNARADALESPGKKENKQIPLAEFRAASKRWPDMVDEKQATLARDFMSKENYQTRHGLAVAYKANKLTRSQIIQRFDAEGITSRNFIDEFLNNIDEASDMEIQEAEEAKPGVWDSIANWWNKDD